MGLPALPQNVNPKSITMAHIFEPEIFFEHHKFPKIFLNHYDGHYFQPYVVPYIYHQSIGQKDYEGLFFQPGIRKEPLKLLSINIHSPITYIPCLLVLRSTDYTPGMINSIQIGHSEGSFASKLLKHTPL